MEKKITWIIYPFGKRPEPIFEGTESECRKFIRDNGLQQQVNHRTLLLDQKKQEDEKHQILPCRNAID